MFLDNLQYPLLLLVASTSSLFGQQQLTLTQEVILRNCRNELRAQCIQTASNLTMQPMDNLFLTPRDVALREWIGLRKDLAKWSYEKPTPQEALAFRDNVDAFFMQTKSANTVTASLASASVQRSIRDFLDETKGIETKNGKTAKIVSKLGKLESAFSHLGITIPFPEYRAGK